MKRVLFSLLAVTALSSVAMAADLPSRRAVAPAYIPPVFTWTGFYAGINAGYGFFNDDAMNGSYLRNTSDGGFIGGGQIGYNYQMGSIVLGIEADIQYADLQRKAYDSAFSSYYGWLDAEFKNEIQWYGTVRPRIGFVPFDRLMIFATGGLAYGGVENSVTIAAANGSYYYTRSKDDTRVGWTVGAGVEYAITNNLLVKGEYAYVDLGRKTTNFDDVAWMRADNNFHVVRVGLNYKF